MKKLTILSFAVLLGFSVVQCKYNQPTTINTMQHTNSIHKFSVKTIEGKEINLSDLKGKKLMIVNTASKCGLTPQFEELEKLYQLYKDKNFVVIGFPSNDFMEQDPGSNEEIVEFCQINYGVSFPMMEKIVVKGENQAPLYQFLTDKSQNLINGDEIVWNFQKFLINENGRVVKTIHPKTSPLDKEIIEWIEN
ncbi:glutathione peroxidase [Capnocytophaga sp. ARDL2]|uniref:glutathione peroxidase n=1 Tax=Capnocytophaga sp. ARDL2 TaxID=3238809 RepID=UPI00355870BA